MFGDTGLWQPVDRGQAKRHKRNGCAGVFSRRIVSRPAEYRLAIRSWLDVGRKNVMESTIAIKGLDSRHEARAAASSSNTLLWTPIGTLWFACFSENDRSFRQRYAFLPAAKGASGDISPIGLHKAAVAFGDVGRNRPRGAAWLVVEKEQAARQVSRTWKNSAGERDGLLIAPQFFECKGDWPDKPTRRVESREWTAEQQRGRRNQLRRRRSLALLLSTFYFLRSIRHTANRKAGHR